MTGPRRLLVLALVTWGAWRLLGGLNACTAAPDSSFWRCAIWPLLAMAVGSAAGGFALLLTDFLYHHSRPALLFAIAGIVVAIVQFPAFSAGLGIAILAVSRDSRRADSPAA